MKKGREEERPLWFCSSYCCWTSPWLAGVMGGVGGVVLPAGETEIDIRPMEVLAIANRRRFLTIVRLYVTVQHGIRQSKHGQVCSM